MIDGQVDREGNHDVVICVSSSKIPGKRHQQHIVTNEKPVVLQFLFHDFGGFIFLRFVHVALPCYPNKEFLFCIFRIVKKGQTNYSKYSLSSHQILIGGFRCVSIAGN